MTVGPGFIHNVRIGALSLPHPPVVNYLLRRGLPSDLQYELSFTHEFAHLQTLPVALAYIAAIFATIHFVGGNLWKYALALFSVQAAWEILAEACTFAQTPHFYRNSYRAVSIVPRLTFWVAGFAIASTCWIVIFS